MPNSAINHPRFFRLVRLVAAVLLGSLGGLAYSAVAHEKGGCPGPGAAGFNAAPSVDLILVSEEQPWLLAAACPVAGKLAQGGPVPLLLVTSPDPSPPLQALVERIRPRGVLVLSPAPEPETARGLPNPFPDLVPRGGQPWGTSLRLAKQFWGKSREVVIAERADAEAVILAAALAARRAEPLLIVEEEGNEAAVRAGLRELEVERVGWVSAGPAAPPAWAAKVAGRVEILDRRAAQEHLLAALGPAAVRSLVLARVPGTHGRSGRTAWLAPYVSLARRAPVVLCRSADAADAEAQVRGLIELGRLRPQTLTILADYASIGTGVATIPPGNNPSAPQGDVATEPCALKGFDQTAALGVGRIPFASLAEASAFFARGLLRERLAAGGPPRVVMVANPVLDGRPLPLCEAISRATVEEFQNFRCRVDEFYHRPAASAEVLSAARTADMIIYEGHIEDQELFKPPRRLPGGAGHERESPVQPQRAAPLEGLPVVILQSCDSLKRGVLREVFESGGVALVGTSTPVHSTSGAAFVKALADGLLYRGESLGESLRDAQNYFVCLQHLKNLRGHKQQAKSQRAALSFRLWGDPELRVFPPGLGEPLHRPVRARWDGPGRLAIDVPAHRLATVENEKYVARLFPGSEAAGMVRRAPGKTARRLTPLYFVKLPLPDGFGSAAYEAIISPHGESPRAVFRIDPMGHFFYLLYYPASERPGQVFSLELATRARRAGP